MPAENSNCMAAPVVEVTGMTGRVEGDTGTLTGVVGVSNVAVDLVDSGVGVCGEVAGVSTPRVVVKVCCSVAAAWGSDDVLFTTSPATVLPFVGGGAMAGTATWMVELLAKVTASKLFSTPVSPCMMFPLSLGFVATTRP